MGTRAAVSLDALRARIQEIEGATIHVRALPTGVEVVDHLTGGLPSPGLVELCGPPGSGRSWLALRLTAEAQARHRAVAWVDFSQHLYPPAAAELGVQLPSLLVVRPPADLAAWAMEQVLRSGRFSLVIGADPASVGRAGHRWARAAESGGCTAVILRTRPGRDLPVSLRLATGHGRVVVLRHRGGPAGLSARLPRILPLHEAE